MEWVTIVANTGLVTISGTIIRVVESQEQIATKTIVDTIEEQSILEEMLEATKPSLARGGDEQLHYLLSTPFRYPPLEWGSRFGSRTEPSLFYGSQQMTTALYETAYYRFIFWMGMEIPPSKNLTTQHTMFRVGYRTKYGVKLHRAPYSAYKELIQSPKDYQATQQLGTALRDAGVEAFEYCSARDLEHGINVALFNSTPFIAKDPQERSRWICETDGEQVVFINEQNEWYQYPISLFELDGKLPLAVV